MRKTFLSLLLVAFNVHLFGQVTKLPPVMSADAAAIGKFGTYDVNYNTGSPGISVPVYSFKSSFLPINVSLNYDSKGFIPNESGHDVGKNWSLSAGGAITRIVNGEPDDKYNPETSLGTGNPEFMSCEKKGFIYGLTSTSTTYSNSYINNLSNYTNLSTWSWNNVAGFTYPVYSLAYEYQPDMFSFNFLGYSGRFFMNNDGTVKVISDTKFKVDVSQLGNRYDFQNMIDNILVQDVGVNAMNTVQVSTIKLTADDGTEFTFGGALKDIEISFSGNINGNNGDPARGAQPKSGVITAWYITKAKNKDGREVIFQNEDFIQQSSGERRDRSVLTYLFEPLSGSYDTYDYYSPYYELRYSFNRTEAAKFCDEHNNHSSFDPIRATCSIVKKCYLSKITTELEELQFYYTKNSRFYTTDNPDFSGDLSTLLSQNKPMVTQRLSGLVARDRKLTGVTIPNSGFEEVNSIARFITFNYNFHRNYLFLESIANGNQSTTFTYNDISNPLNLPQPLTYGIDYLGYYNGKNSNTSFLGNITVGTSFNMQYPTADREPDAAYSTIGILKEIVHPTKGKTVFDFENHVVGKHIERTTQYPILPTAVTINSPWKTVPGLRIKKIENIPGQTVEFEYKTNWETQTNMASSGILNYQNVTGYYFEKSGDPDAYTKLRQENNLVQSSTYYESPVSYSEVVKKYAEGFEKFIFSTHLTNPDRVNPVSTAVFNTGEVSSTQFINQMNKIHFRKSSVEIERGKLLFSYVYDNSNNLKQSKEFLYNTNSDRFNYFGTSVSKPGLEGVCTSPGTFVGMGVLNVYENFYYHDQLTKEISTEVTSAGNFTTTTEYEYISLVDPLLRKKKVTNSKGEVVEHEYKYAEDSPASQSGPVLSAMISKNMKGVVLEDIMKQNGVTLSKTIFTYGLVNTVPALIKEEVSNEVKDPGQMQNVLDINKYTSIGQVAEAQTPGNVITTYKWDYEGHFLVAKIANASEENVRYTSFENSIPSPDPLTEWQFTNTARAYDQNSATGRNYYNLSGYPVSASDLNASITYVLSYWKKDDAGITVTGGGFIGTTIMSSANGWSLVEGELSGTTTVQISGNAKLDEVRLYPKEASIESYTYEVLLGLTSKCDIANKITYYKYDAYGRLALIRDQNRNILKKICYNYSGEAEDCSLCSDFEPNWQNTDTPPTCQTDACGNTGYQWQEQEDINPCSGQPLRQVLVYNPTACAPANGVIIYYDNMMPSGSSSGFSVTYTNISTAQVYTFSIPTTGSGTLGCIPAGSYRVVIGKTGNIWQTLYGTGCSYQTGTSTTTFRLVVVGGDPACNVISIEIDSV